MSDTHEFLVDQAALWMRSKSPKGGRCEYVFAELVTAARSTCDVIGWGYGLSTQVEVKVSRRDYQRDKHKGSRRIGRVMGNRRYYLTPQGLLQPGELYDGWGLLEWDGRKVVKVVDAPFHEHTQRSAQEEFLVLCSALRRTRERQPFDPKRCRFLPPPK